VELLNHNAPWYSDHAAYSVPSAAIARSRLPLCQISLLIRPLPSPPDELDRLSGLSKVAPPSRDRAKKMSPPCEPPENTISCQTMKTSPGCCGERTIRGSHEKTCAVRDTFTGRGKRGLPSRV
jgi:hypothetical protein